MELVGGRYVLEGPLGQGAMGEVYRVRHAQLGKPFALKIISKAFAGNTALRERFNEEAKLASEISHPNIVSVVDFGEDDQFGAYMVMELVDGEPLLVADGSGPMPVARALDVLGQVSDALDHIHKRGIIHGDVKAENILVAREAEGVTGTRKRRVVRLLDFGLARRHGAEETEVSGSPHYLAPERVKGGAPSVASDIYALGVLAYVLFTRTHPFDGDLLAVLTAQIHQAADTMSSRRAEGLDDAIEALVARAMAKDPSDRHATAAAFRYEVNAVMEMLDLKRQRRRSSGQVPVANPREVMIGALFEHSHLPQAVISLEGEIVLANRALAVLLGNADTRLEGTALDATLLAASVPGLSRAIRNVRVSGKPAELRARVGKLELSVWVVPTVVVAEHVQLIVRVEQL